MSFFIHGTDLAETQNLDRLIVVQISDPDSGTELEMVIEPGYCVEHKRNTHRESNDDTDRSIDFGEQIVSQEDRERHQDCFFDYLERGFHVGFSFRF